MKDRAIIWPKLIMLVLLIVAGFALKRFVHFTGQWFGAPIAVPLGLTAAVLLIYWLMDHRAAARKRQGQPPARRD